MCPMRGVASDFYELSIPGGGEGILLLYLYLPLPIVHLSFELVKHQLKHRFRF